MNLKYIFFVFAILCAIVSVLFIFSSGASEKSYHGAVAVDTYSGVCGNGIVEPGEFCDDNNNLNLDGCSMDCKKETDETIYVAPYMGNIDGDFSEEWYYFYDMITRFHDLNRIPSGFSIYPASIKEGKFGEIFRKMHNSPYIEFVQKGYSGSEEEQRLDKLSFERQKEIIKKGQDYFRKMSEKITGDSSVPVAYNQPQGRFTNSIRDALRSLGFHIFFEMYENDDLLPVNSTYDFDVLQYGVSFTTDGEAGRQTVFRKPDEIIKRIKEFEREDVNILYIKGRKVVPVWCHQSDFEDREKDNVLDKEKWKIYTETMLRLRHDPDIVMVRPSDIYDMRHKTIGFKENETI